MLSSSLRQPTILAACLLLTALLVACAPSPEGQVAAHLDGAYACDALRVHRGDGYQLLHPADARIERIEASEGARSAVRLLGPNLSLCPTAEDWTWSGAAYDLELRTYDNHAGLGSAEWAAAHLLGEDRLVEEESATRVAAYEAYRVARFGGDSPWITLVVARPQRVLTLTYNDAPVENNPLAPLARDVHALIAGTLRFVDG